MTHPVPIIRGRYRKPKPTGRPPKSGARALAKHIATGTLDQRTWIARTLRALRDDLARDRGCFRPTDDPRETARCYDGTCAHLSAGERMLLDRCAAATLICSTIEGHVFGHADRLVDDAGELLPILRKGYVSHVQSLSRMLQALGLRPERAEQIPSLESYLRRTAPPPAPASAADQGEPATAADDAATGSPCGDTANPPAVPAEPERRMRT
jgi:hypothetical protein